VPETNSHGKHTKKLKKLKNNTLDLGVSLQGTPVPPPPDQKNKQKICGFGPVRIPAGTTSRSFRKSESSFKPLNLHVRCEPFLFTKINGCRTRR
jgi:hypothetical protein